jgi:polysaccharide biosynthesis transport protein
MTTSMTLNDYVAALWRRKWIVAQALIIVPVIAVFLSTRKPAVYEATSQVLLSRDDLGSQLLNLTNTNLYTDPVRYAATQAAIGSTPALAQRVVDATQTHLSAGALLGDTSVDPSPNADLLYFNVKNNNPDLAVRLATAYGRQFTIYRRQLDTSAAANSLAQIQQKLRQLRAAGATGTAEYSSLQKSAQQLQLYENLQTSNTYLIRTPSGAAKISPRPTHDAILGVVGGLLLGLCLAFIVEAVDRRIRDAEELESSLGLPLLGRIAEPSREFRRGDTLAMLANPSSRDAEAYRVVRMNLEFMNADKRAKLIMVTSSVAREGKSTTVASLAIALARSGHRVALVDLDLHAPAVHRLFGLPNRRGLTDVAMGQSALAEVMNRIAIDGPARSTPALRSTNGAGHARLDVLTSGIVPLNPAEFSDSRAVENVLAQLKKEYEYVFVDGPPLLVSAAVSLSAKVDGLIMIARVGLVERGSVRDVVRTLERSTATKLGVVITGGHQRGYYTYYGPGPVDRSSPKQQSAERSAALARSPN